MLVEQPVISYLLTAGLVSRRAGFFTRWMTGYKAFGAATGRADNLYLALNYVHLTMRQARPLLSTSMSRTDMIEGIRCYVMQAHLNSLSSNRFRAIR